MRYTALSMVVRVSETEGRAQLGTQLRFAFALAKAEATNLIEKEARPLADDIAPIEIKTFRVSLR